MQRVTIAAILLMAMAAGLHSQTTQPAETDSPKAALTAFSLAMQDGDVNAILFYLHADNPRQQRMACTLANMAAAMADLRKQAIATFGEKSAREITGDTAAGWTKESQRLRDSAQRIEGDTATLTAPDGTATNLRRIDGRWKLPVGQLAKDQDPAALDAVLKMLDVRTKVIRGLTDEIAAGKYKTADLAAQVLRAKLLNPEEHKKNRPANPH